MTIFVDNVICSSKRMKISGAGGKRGIEEGVEEEEEEEVEEEEVEEEVEEEEEEDEEEEGGVKEGKYFLSRRNIFEVVSPGTPYCITLYYLKRKYYYF